MLSLGETEERAPLCPNFASSHESMIFFLFKNKMFKKGPLTQWCHLKILSMTHSYMCTKDRYTCVFAATVYTGKT
jgi:hypothetical protein